MEQVGDILGTQTSSEQKLRRATLIAVADGYASNITAALYCDLPAPMLPHRQERLRRLRKAAGDIGLTVPLGDDRAVEAALVRFARHAHAIDRLYPPQQRLKSRLASVRAA